MAPDMDFLARDLAQYISQRLSIHTDVVLDIPWQERERRLDDGEIDFCWLCGLPYVRKARHHPGMILPLVAPIMSANRYKGLPIYFSDVIVRSDSRFQHLEDLQGVSWAFNEPGSQSGYGVVLYALARQGKDLGYFSRVTQSGAHQTSLEWILSGEVDATAMDSTVLEMEIANRPEIAERIRVIDTFGPSPIPPWVISARIPSEIRAALEDLLVSMDSNPAGQAILKNVKMTHFVPVTDKDYDPIRDMASISGVPV